MPAQTRSANRRTTRSSSQTHGSSSSRAATGTSKANGTVTSKTSEKSKSKPTRKRTRHESGKLKVASPDEAMDFAKAAANLEVLMKLPVDIFIEIAKYLHPLDLAVLSKVNKFFHQLFVDQRSTLIWRSAKLGIPRLPPCPESICEPQYAILLFKNICSACGKRTSRELDATLLIRLCAKCYDNQAVDASTITDRTLVFVSYDNVRHRIASWCLDKDVKGVESRLGEFDASGDAAGKLQWMRERRKKINRRYWDAQPLREWLGVWSAPREAELKQIKVTRQAEIESRLVNLGWEEIDLTPHGNWENMRWKSLLHDTERLTDEAWEKLLPNLLVYLKRNREERLHQGEIERKSILRNYLSVIIAQLGPFAQAIPDGESLATGYVNTNWNFEQDNLLLAHPFPSAHTLYSWPELKSLMEDNAPAERFKTSLDEQRDMFRNLILTWRNTLEAGLINLLPGDTQSPELDNIPGLTLTIGSREDTNPLSNVPTDLNKLLRADVVFMGQDRLRFYPDDFVNASVDASSVTYHVGAAEIAKALMSTIGRPHASYLELKVLGRVFHCGRCNSPPHYMTWQELVRHYLAEADIWSQHSVAKEVREAQDFTLVFTHDVSMVKPNKPLVRIADDGEKIMGNYNGTRRCMLCQSVLIRRWLYAEYIVDHIRDVHLIGEPELGKDYVRV